MTKEQLQAQIDALEKLIEAAREAHGDVGEIADAIDGGSDEALTDAEKARLDRILSALAGAMKPFSKSSRAIDESKMIGSYNGVGTVNAVLSWIGDKITGLFSRADDVEAEAERQAESPTGTALTPGSSTRPSLNAVALRGALTTLQDHLERVTSEWERVQSDADALKPKIEDIAAGIRAITENMDTQYADNTAVALTNRLSVYSEQWDALVAQAAQLRTVVLEIQSQVQAVEAQVEGKAEELALARKAFWDPQDDEDSAALKERIDALAARVSTAVEDNDEEEQTELLAELRDLDDGLSDDTRFRVQALISRLEGKSMRHSHKAADIPQAIADAEDELRDLRRQAEAAIEGGSPTEVRRALQNISMDASKLYLRIPVSDYNANPIPAGRELSAQLSEFNIWLEEQYERFTINSDGRALARKAPGAHTLYR